MPDRFDVFLSHATPDKPLVEELARRLTRENLKPWLDKWNLIPGQAWKPEIEAALAECAACAVFIGPGGFGPWQTRGDAGGHRPPGRGGRVGGERRPFRVIPVLLPGVERPERSRLPALPGRDDLGRIPRHARRPRGVPPAGLRHPGDRAGRRPRRGRLRGRVPVSRPGAVRRRARPALLRPRGADRVAARRPEAAAVGGPRTGSWRSSGPRAAASRRWPGPG